MKYIFWGFLITILIIISVLLTCCIGYIDPKIKEAQTKLEKLDLSTKFTIGKYKSKDEAAKAWFDLYKPNQDQLTKLVETGSNIYWWTLNNQKIFSFTPRIIGDHYRVDTKFKSPLPNNGHLVAVIHSHAELRYFGDKIWVFLNPKKSPENFSGEKADFKGDMGIARENKFIAYLVTPSLKLKEFMPLTNQITLVP